MSGKKNIVAFIFLLASLFLSVTASHAQSKELMDRIKLNNRISKLLLDAKYDSIVMLSKHIPFRDSLYLYSNEGSIAKAYFELGDTLTGLRYLTKAIENEDVSELGNLRYIYSKYKLDSNKGYQYIVKNFDRIHDKYVGRLNGYVLKKCLEILYTDNRTRFVYDLCKDSLEKKYASYSMWASDSMNIVAFSDLLQELGHYPGISEIGKNMSSYLTYKIGHWSSRLDSASLFNCLKISVLKGQIPGWIAGYILDRREMQLGRLMLYDEYGTSSDYDGDLHIYPPVQDVDHLDSRRAVFLMPPMYKLLEKENCRMPQGYDVKTQK